MRFSPSNRREWLELVLLPFQIFVVVAPFWLRAWKFMTQGILLRGMFADEVIQVKGYYLPCFCVFVIATIVQFAIGWRRAALVSAASAAFTFLVYNLYLMPMCVK